MEMRERERKKEVQRFIEVCFECVVISNVFLRSFLRLS